MAGSGWDYKIGDRTLKFSALDMADRLGWGDDIGLTQQEIDSMIAAATATAGSQYRAGVEKYGGNVAGTLLERSGVANSAFASMAADMLGVGQRAALAAEQESKGVLLQERQMYNSLLSQRDSTINNANIAQWQAEQNKTSWFDRVLQGASVVSGLVGPGL